MASVHVQINVKGDMKYILLSAAIQYSIFSLPGPHLFIEC